MAKAFLKDVGFAVQRVTDEHSQTDLEVLKPRELGAGSFVFGAVIEGAFIPLIELKGGGVIKKIDAAKARAAEAAAKAAEQTQPEA